MKPVKNRIFCVDCQRPKMLFESKSKAMNFIKFNADEIMEESGVAPTRAYFCNSCCGWHVTSHVHPPSRVDRIKQFIKHSRQMIDEEQWSAAMRFLCYAKSYLQMHKTHNAEDRLSSEIAQVRKWLDVAYITHKLHPRIPFCYLDLSFRLADLDIVSAVGDDDHNGVLYTLRPKLLTTIGHKYYYVIWNGRLSPDEYAITMEKNGFREEDDMLQMLSCHSLNIVEVEDNCLETNHKNQYETVGDIVQGEIIATWISGLNLRVFERVRKQYTLKYNTRSGFDYWIRFGSRNLHFYLGRQAKYSCIVSQTPIDTSKPLYVFRSKNR